MTMTKQTGTMTRQGRPLARLRRMGSGLAVLALALGMAAAAAGPASANVSPGAGVGGQPGAGASPAAAKTVAAQSTAVRLPAGVMAVASGSIVYVQANNVWVMAPDGTGKRQITRDGTASSPYLSPTESNDGTIVAVRNSAAGDVGSIYVLNRAGYLMNRFTPPQYDYHGVGVSCSADYQVAPTGIQRATVSPDGLHVAYTARAMFQNVGCSTVVNVYSSYVVGRTGSGPVHLTDIQNLDSSEVGGWSGNGTILLSNLAFAEVKLYTVSVPGNRAALWKADTDEWDTAWEGPSRGGAVLATDGWSAGGGSSVVRLWNAPSLTAPPTVRCEIAATAGTSDPSVFGTPLAWPVSMAPTGSGVTWWETNGDASTSTPDEGIYVTAVPSSGCPSSKTLIASGGSYAFWGSAAVNAPVPPDRVAPVVTVTAKPAGYLRSTSATIAYRISDATDSSVTTTCTLDARATTCASPKSLSHLAQGRHSFVITGRDHAGNIGRAAVTWTVDTGLPRISVSAPALVTTATVVGYHWSGADSVSGVASYDIQYATASYTGKFTAWRTRSVGTRATSWSMTGLQPGYTYCVRVRARDRAGNVSAYSTARCTTRPLDDRSLHASAGWSRPRVIGAFLHTESTSTHAGATLTLANARVSRVGILATVTSKGGPIAVYLGRTKIGTVSLRSSTNHYQQVLWLRTVSARTGTLILRTASAAQVRIDGLVDLRTP